MYVLIGRVYFVTSEAVWKNKFRYGSIIYKLIRKVEPDLFEIMFHSFNKKKFSGFNEFIPVSWILNGWVIFLLERNVIQSLNKTDP